MGIATEARAYEPPIKASASRWFDMSCHKDAAITTRKKIGTSNMGARKTTVQISMSIMSFVFHESDHIFSNICTEQNFAQDLCTM